MSLRYSYSMLFREFQFFAGDDTTADWLRDKQNYAVSSYGHKIAIADLSAKKVFVVSAAKESEGQALVDAIKALAVDNTASETTIKNAITANTTNNAAYYYAIDLTKDPIYLKALAMNPDLNTDAGNFATWLSGLAEASRAVVSNPKVAPVIDAFTPSVFSEYARTHLFSENSGSSLADSFILTDFDVAVGSASIDGGSGGNDSISVSDTTQTKMSAGLSANISGTDDTITGNNKTVAITANTASFQTSNGTKVTATLSGIDSLIGTKFDDYLIGNSGTNYFDPGAGNDVIKGNSDPATYHGGNLSYKDRVAYWGDMGKGITATATSAQNAAKTAYIPIINVVDTMGGKDALYNISYVVGSIYADTYNGAKKDASTNPYNTEFAGLAGADIINGSYSTRVAYNFDPTAVTVNLSTTAIKDANGVLVAGGTALDGFGYVDKLSQIFGVRGSDFSDLINLGNAAEVATGEGGDDKIYGNSGNDDLWGSAGNDLLVGGAGVDLMVGRSFSYTASSDSLPTGDTDIFKFNSVADASGTSIKTDAGANVGDIILDFEVDADLIDLSAIDANAKMRGNQSFKVDENSTTTFTKTAGQLIFNDATLKLAYGTSGTNKHPFQSDFAKASSSTASDTQSGLLVQGDIQGDGKADFSIFLIGVDSSEIHTSDFML